MAPFVYVIAVDFETTCWENQTGPQWRTTEIIEFAAVLINLRTGDIKAEFHKYIKPSEKPILSAHCIDLRGITQQTVDNGTSLQSALTMFDAWVQKEVSARNLILAKTFKDNKLGNCTFVTWSNADFGTVLPNECGRKHLHRPTLFNQWIDIQLVYQRFYNSHNSIGLANALHRVGLSFKGRQYSGIDCAKNLAKLTYNLVHNGANLLQLSKKNN